MPDALSSPRGKVRAFLWKDKLHQQTRIREKTCNGLSGPNDAADFRESDTKDRFAGGSGGPRQRRTSSCLTSYHGARCEYKCAVDRHPIRMHDGGLHNHGGQLAANRAAACLHARRRRRMMRTAIVRAAAAGRLASSIRHEQRRHQDDRHCRAMKHALRHVFRVTPVRQRGPVTGITRVFRVVKGSSRSASTNVSWMREHPARFFIRIPCPVPRPIS